MNILARLPKGITRLPKGHRFVKQQGYKKGNFYNWAIYTKDNYLLSLGGKTKKEARQMAIKVN